METQRGLEPMWEALQVYEPDVAAYPDDYSAWLTCRLAYEAAEEGNFGVGCILVDPAGTIIVEGHNEVFNPYFRSDRHAEMVVMDAFEDEYRDVDDLCGYALFTSLEPCAMCLARLIDSGVETVKYVAPDLRGGMVRWIHALPPAQIELARGQSFSQAQASPDVVDLALALFHHSASVLDERMRRRCSGTGRGGVGWWEAADGL